MKQVKTSLMVTSMVAVMALAACGGGGGGSGTPPPTGGPSPTPTITPTPNPTPTATPTATPSPTPTGTPTPPPAGSVTVTGTVTFDSVPFAATGGALNYAGTTQKPVRGAIVEALNSATQAVIASGTTSSTGTYSLFVPQGSSVIIRVKAQMQKTGAAPTWDFAVKDNTQANALYAMALPAVTASAATTTQNLNAPSGWSGTNAAGSYTATRVAGPFAVLDTVYNAYNKVLSAKADAVFPALNVFWSVNNKPAAGNLALGEITTSFFTSDGNGNRSIYLLGQADVDSDEYDSPVVAHEWGHYFQNAFSRDDSVGGSHSGGEFLDMRVAFSEGWGNAWSGMALNQSFYADSNSARQQGGGRMNLAAPVANAQTPGWFKEDSVQYILYSLHQSPGVGFTPIFNAMTALKSGTALTSIHAFAAALSDPTAKSALNTLFAAQGIGQNLDQFGTGETNNGGTAANLPIYKALTVGTALTNQCLSTTKGVSNKLGNYLFYTFNAPTAKSYTVTITGGTDPDFDLYQNKYLGGGYGPDSGSEVAAANLAAGTTVLVVGDASLAANTAPCFTVSVQ